MIKSSIEKLAKEIGWDIGCSDDKVQSDLLNGFCEALYDSMKPHDSEMQICYIVTSLTPKTRKIIKLINNFCELKDI